MKRLLSLILIISTLMPLAGYAQSPTDLWDAGNKAYAEGKYAEAADAYISILDAAPAVTQHYAPVYYNLGNAYFKQGELSQAILAYERCLRLAPTDKNARYNLQYAQSQIVDNIADTHVFFLRQWFTSFRNLLTESTWMWLSISMFALTLLCLLVFAFARVLALRKTGFYISIICLIISVAACVNAGSLHHRDTVREEAIITRGIVNAKASPDRSGTDLFTLHEGTKVIIHEALGEYVNIHVGNYVGWIPANTLERI